MAAAADSKLPLQLLPLGGAAAPGLEQLFEAVGGLPTFVEATAARFAAVLEAAWTRLAADFVSVSSFIMLLKLKKKIVMNYFCIFNIFLNF